MKKEIKSYCIKCDKKVPYHYVSKPVVLSVNGVTFTYDEYSAICDNCGGEIYVPKLNDVNCRSRMLAHQIAVLNNKANDYDISSYTVEQLREYAKEKVVDSNLPTVRAMDAQKELRRRGVSVYKSSPRKLSDSEIESLEIKKDHEKDKRRFKDAYNLRNFRRTRNFKKSPTPRHK